MFKKKIISYDPYYLIEEIYKILFKKIIRINELFSLNIQTWIAQNKDLESNYFQIIKIIKMLFRKSSNNNFNLNFDLLFYFGSEKKLNAQSSIAPIVNNYKKKYKCLVINSDLKISYYFKKYSSILDCNIYYYLNTFKRIQILFYALIFNFRLYFTLKNFPEIRSFFLKRFFACLLENYQTLLRIYFFEKKIISENVKIFFTHNEQNAISSELLYLSKKNAIKSVLISTEHPTRLLIPIKSDYTFVFDDVVRKQLINFYKKKKNIFVIGHSESEYVDKAIKNNKINKFSNQRKSFIFFSEYIPEKIWNRLEVTQYIVEYLIYAASIFKDWDFYIKPRPYHYGYKFPLEDKLKKIPNLKILNERIDLISLINSKNCKVFCSVSSLASYTVAKHGKISLLLKIYKNSYKHEFLEKKCLVVKNIHNILKILNNYKTIQLKFKKNIDSYQSRIFKKIDSILYEKK